MHRRSFIASAIGVLSFLGIIMPAEADDSVPLPFDEWEVTLLFADGIWDGAVVVSRSVRKGYRDWVIKHERDLDDFELQAMTRDMMTGRIQERRRWFQSQDNITVA